MKTITIIPAYNEEKNIAGVIKGVRKALKAPEILVINDCSSDETSKLAKLAGATVIDLPLRLNYGATIQTGFEYALRNNYDIVILLDGDGQHNPDDIPRVLAPVLNGEADLVVGSRFLHPPQRTNIRRYRKFGIDVITWLYNFGSKIKVFDSQSCFRAHSRRLLEAVDVAESGFGFSVEVLIKARRKGFVIAEVPISCVYHSQGSSLNPVAHGLGVAFSVIRLRLRNEARVDK